LVVASLSAVLDEHMMVPDTGLGGDADVDRRTLVKLLGLLGMSAAQVPAVPEGLPSPAAAGPVDEDTVERAVGREGERVRVVTLLDLAAAQVRQGRMEAAAGSAVEALDLLGEGWFPARLDRVRDQMAGAGGAAVRALDERLAAVA